MPMTIIASEKRYANFLFPIKSKRVFLISSIYILSFSMLRLATAKSTIAFVANTAVKRFAMIPTERVNPNPFTEPSPRKKRIAPVIIVVIFESRIADHAR